MPKVTQRSNRVRMGKNWEDDVGRGFQPYYVPARTAMEITFTHWVFWAGPERVLRDRTFERDMEPLFSVDDMVYIKSDKDSDDEDDADEEDTHMTDYVATNAKAYQIIAVRRGEDVFGFLEPETVRQESDDEELGDEDEFDGWDYGDSDFDNEPVKVENEPMKTVETAELAAAEPHTEDEDSTGLPTTEVGNTQPSALVTPFDETEKEAGDADKENKPVVVDDNDGGSDSDDDSIISKQFTGWYYCLDMEDATHGPTAHVSWWREDQLEFAPLAMDDLEPHWEDDSLLIDSHSLVRLQTNEVQVVPEAALQAEVNEVNPVAEQPNSATKANRRFWSFR